MAATDAAVLDDVAARSTADPEGRGHIAVGPWDRLRRFLVLGCDGGTYRVGPRELTRAHAAAVEACLAEDGLRVVAEVLAVRAAGRAPQPEPALLALALAAAAECDETRRAALAALPRVALTGPELFRFGAHAQALRGWGRGLRRAVGTWYNAKDPAALVDQALGHRPLNGWSHADLLRLGHPKAPTPAHNAVYKWLVDGDLLPGAFDDQHEGAALARLAAFGRLQRETDPAAAARLIRAARLPRAAIPARLLGAAEVWAALLEELPLGVMLRHLGPMGRAGLLTAGSDATRTVADRLGDGARLREARVHPIAVLAATQAYARGLGDRTGASWPPVPAVIAALDAAFEAAIANVAPTGQRLRLALDVSPAMDATAVAGMPFVTARDVSAAMALVTARVEPDREIVAWGDRLVPVPIAPRDRLADVLATLRAIPSGPASTSSVLPIRDAMDSGAAVDAFVSYTAGPMEDDPTTPLPGRRKSDVPEESPADVLAAYRTRTGIPARRATIALCARDLGLADPTDPTDPGHLDVIGFDPTTPSVLDAFVRGEL